MSVPGHFSNGPSSLAPEKGFPFGGLLAALCAQAMRQGLSLTAPLRTLSVQYLSAARFGEQVAFRPRLLRGGRNVIYAAVEAEQDGRMTHHATGTYGLDAAPPPLTPLHAPPPPLDKLDPKATIRGPMSPHFAQHVEYRFDGGPNILGGRNWNHGAYSPDTKLWYSTGMEVCNNVTAAKQEPVTAIGGLSLGLSDIELVAPAGKKADGWLGPLVCAAAYEGVSWFTGSAVMLCAKPSAP